MRFNQKICFVTGGGSGIGRATCMKFAKEGARTVVVDLNKDTASETVRLINEMGGEAIFLTGDVSSSADVTAAIDATIRKWERIDVLVNNAAIMTFTPVIELEDAEWDRVIANNLRSVFLCSKYSLPHMNGGAIVNVSSIHAHETESNLAPYAASKGGMEAFTRALSSECTTRNVRVNCVAPGGVNTPLLWSNPRIQALNRESVMYVEPDAIAEVICFLASDAAAAINGSTIMADLGLLARI